MVNSLPVVPGIGYHHPCVAQEVPMRSLLATGLALAVLTVALTTHAADQEPPLGTITVGVDPTVYEVVSLGVIGWNDTGVVRFVVEPTGCGTGDLTVCLMEPSDSNTVAVFDATNGHLVKVHPGKLWRVTPAVICHEFGHFLGLRWNADGSVYHRDGYLSCMRGDGQGPAAPDALDLVALGFPDAPASPATLSALCPAPLAAHVAQYGGSTDGTWIPMADALVWFDFTQGRITEVVRPLLDGGVESFSITDEPSDDGWVVAFRG